MDPIATVLFVEIDYIWGPPIRTCDYAHRAFHAGCILRKICPDLYTVWKNI